MHPAQGQCRVRLPHGGRAGGVSPGLRGAGGAGLPGRNQQTTGSGKPSADGRRTWKGPGLRLRIPAPGSKQPVHAVCAPGGVAASGGRREADQDRLGPGSAETGGPDWTKLRTDADSDVIPSCGMGIVYVSSAWLSAISMPCTKLRMRAFRSGSNRGKLLDKFPATGVTAPQGAFGFEYENSIHRTGQHARLWVSSNPHLGTNFSMSLFRVGNEYLHRFFVSP